MTALLSLPHLLTLAAGCGGTVLLYCLVQLFAPRIRGFSAAHGLLLCSVLIAALLGLLHVPYAEYKVGGSWLTFLLGPATIALAVPLHRHSEGLKRYLPAVLWSVFLGSLAAIASAGCLVFWLGGTRVVALSMMPKSTTAAISMAISRQIGGVPELTAIFTVITGLWGALIGPALLRAVGVREDVALGAALGTASHGIGTARVYRESELQGSASALAMALGGLISSALFMLLQYGL